MSSFNLMQVHSKVELKAIVKKNVFMFLGDKFRGDRIENMQAKLKIIDLICLICVAIGVLFAVVAAENNISFTFPDPNKINLKDVIISFNPQSTIVIVLRSIVTFTTFIAIICLVLHYVILLKLNKYKLRMHLKENLFTSGYYKYLLLEILLNVVHTPPTVDGFILIKQRRSSVDEAVNIDYLLTIFLIFARSYQIIKFAAFHSRWCSYKIEQICWSNNTPLDFMFSIKAEFKQNPFRLVFTTMGYSIFVFGYSVRSIEMFFMPGSEMGLDWRYYWNGMWCVILTMSTVGFGDLYPISILGRIIVCISAFWGTFLISLMVAALSLTVEFNSQEEAAYQSIRSANFELKYGKAATKMLQAALRYYWHVRSGSSDDTVFKQTKSQLLMNLKRNCQEFRLLKLNKKDYYENQLIANSLNKIENNITVEMDKIKQQLGILETVRAMLEEYNANQKTIKQKEKILFMQLEEINNFREKQLKEIL